MRARTAQAMLLLCAARLAVGLVPFRYWRGTLGRLDPGPEPPSSRGLDPGGPARRTAVHVERGAARLPFATRCLPRAMALCWLLRRARIAYRFKIAARPAASRPAVRMKDDTLHAWVEAGDATVIGALPGPWLVVLTLYG